MMHFVSAFIAAILTLFGLSHTSTSTLSTNDEGAQQVVQEPFSASSTMQAIDMVRQAMQQSTLQTTVQGSVPNPSAATADIGLTGTLLLGYKDVQLPYVANIGRNVAGGLCGLVYGDTCQWNGKDIPESAFYIYGSVGKQPMINISNPASGTTISYGTIVPIIIKDPGPAGRHKVYLVHLNLLSEPDEVHQANVVSQIDNDDGTETLSWDGNEVYVNEAGTEQVAQLKAGHYTIVVANVDTGVEGGTPGLINLVTDNRGNDVPTSDLLKPYAANTPLLNSYWDGRGIIDDGKGGVDTLTLVGKRSDVVIYRGVDMPDQDQYQVLVFYRKTDNVVIVTANVEIIKFDDETDYTTDLIGQLPPNPANANGSQQAISSVDVPGMKQYTDTELGFSFWYPSSWLVSSTAYQTKGVYGGSLLENKVGISSGKPGETIVLDLVYSPNREVELTDPKGSGLDEVFMFDPNSHTWFHNSNGVFGLPKSAAADTSQNTMGGLHMFFTNGGMQQVVVPLSAQNFIITEPGNYNAVTLARTILATDPSVATPASIAQQQATIQAEKDAYTGH